MTAAMLKRLAINHLIAGDYAGADRYWQAYRAAIAGNKQPKGE